jgi:protein-disulfide isomerase
VGPSLGAADAPVVIVAFSDFQCPFCARAKETAEKVLIAYSGRVRLHFRQFPLPFHENAFKAAEASLCANDQGKFWALHDHMFAHQAELDLDSLKKSARSVGLDGPAFDKCVDAGMHASEVTQSIAAGKLLGVEGTPAFFINGIALHGAQPFERFTEIIDAELAPK